MTIRADSYSSTSEVLAYTRHLLDGQSAWNSTTRPTLTEVEKFIDRASGILNTSLRGVGISTPISNSTAKLACDDWVTDRATEYVELTQRGVGYNDQEGSRTAGFRNLNKSANDFASEMRKGFVELGVTVSRKASSGLAFTGAYAFAQRDDPSDTSLEQPLFRRHQFDDSTATEYGSSEEDDND